MNQMASKSHPTAEALGLRMFSARYPGRCAMCSKDIAQGERVAMLPMETRKTWIALNLMTTLSWQYAHEGCLPTLISEDYIPFLRRLSETLMADTDPAWPKDYVGFSKPDAGFFLNWSSQGFPVIAAHSAARRLTKYIETQLGGGDSQDCVALARIARLSHAANADGQAPAVSDGDAVKHSPETAPQPKPETAPSCEHIPGSVVRNHRLRGEVFIRLNGDGLIVELEPPWISPEHATVKDAIKKYGARWDKDAKVWRCQPSAISGAHAELSATKVAVTPDAVASIAAALDRRALSRAATLDSNNVSVDVDAVRAKLSSVIPAGMALYPYQEAGIAFLEAAGGRALIGDEMGLGKTVQAICWLAIHPEVMPALIIVPAVVAPNWVREFKTWAPGVKVQRISSAADAIDDDTQVVVATYGLWERYQVEEQRLLGALSKEREKLVPGSISPAEQDKLAKKIDRILEQLAQVQGRRSFTPGSIVCDESHYLKNAKAKRTRSVLETCEATKPSAVICLSGTPLVNRPLEFFTTLNLLRSAEFKNWFYYAQRYCGGHYEEVYAPGGYGRTKRVFVCGGASNLDELNDRLKDAMVRRLKADVLKELPDKVHIDTQVELTPAERRAYDEAISIACEMHPEDEPGHHLAVITAARQAVGEAKVRATVEWVMEYKEQGLPVLVFAHHEKARSAVLASLRGADVRVDTIDGSVPQMKRQRIVDAFQAGGLDCLVVSIKAGGVGITLTAASHVIIMERAWTPGDEQQAEDRAHRIGQKDVVVVRVLRSDTFIDNDMDELLRSKASIIAAALDGNCEVPESMDIRAELIKRWRERQSTERKKSGRRKK